MIGMGTTQFQSTVDKLPFEENFFGLNRNSIQYSTCIIAQQ